MPTGTYAHTVLPLRAVLPGPEVLAEHAGLGGPDGVGNATRAASSCSRNAALLAVAMR